MDFLLTIVMIMNDTEFRLRKCVQTLKSIKISQISCYIHYLLLGGSRIFEKGVSEPAISMGGGGGKDEQKNMSGHFLAVLFWSHH